VVTDFAGAIKSTYSAIEPWVRYGFELATYAVGWVPYVGWLSGQIMIFYNLGERIVRSLVFNSADWLWGPLPLGEGLRNVAQDSWNALVQFGIDEWNFFLPPLPPLPLADQQTTTAPTQARGALGEHVGKLDRISRKAGDAPAVAPPAVDTGDEPVLDTPSPGAEAAETERKTKRGSEVTAEVLSDEPVDVSSIPDLIQTETAAPQLSKRAADAKAPRHSAQPGTAQTKRSAPAFGSENGTTSRDSDTDERGSQPRKASSNERRSGAA
jgi:hypothetical protein